MPVGWWPVAAQKKGRDELETDFKGDLMDLRCRKGGGGGQEEEAVLFV